MESKEFDISELNQGKKFEQFTSQNFGSQEWLDFGSIPVALLRTNEHIDLENLHKEIGKKPNGVVYGVGAGAIFSILDLFDSNHPPKAIFAVDLQPEAVLTGRIVIDLIKQSNNFGDFINQLTSEEKVLRSLKYVISTENTPRIKYLFEDTEFGKYFNFIQLAVNEYKNTPVIKHQIKGTIVSPLVSINNNWNILKVLAENGNIGFGLGNFFDPEIMKYLQNNEYFRTKSNLIYATNLIDIVQTDQMQSDRARWDEFYKLMIRVNKKGNKFIFTSKRNLMSLIGLDSLPKDPPKNFIFN